MKFCPACSHKMKIVVGKLPDIPNKELVFKLHYKCLNCGCSVYKTNSIELMEKVIDKFFKENSELKIVN